MLAGGLTAALAAASPAEDRSGEVVTVRRPQEIEFTATVHAKDFQTGSMAGYHAIVWKGGTAAHAALLEAEVTDRQVLEALQSLGAKPGNNLSMAVWEERKNPEDPAPGTIIAGPVVEVFLRLPGRRDLVPLAGILEDPGGHGFAMRFGGNEANIPKWMSGCIVCLYSCPGSKVGNAGYTVRDFVNQATRFRVKPDVLPPDGTPVRVVLRVAA
jgi:hypothetical protein